MFTADKKWMQARIADKSANIRNNMYTEDKNWIQARIADKTADTSLKLLKLIPVFYCLDKSVV
jgi:hypothetical protein